MSKELSLTENQRNREREGERKGEKEGLEG